jgi:hypothetical protein
LPGLPRTEGYPFVHKIAKARRRETAGGLSLCVPAPPALIAVARIKAPVPFLYLAIAKRRA